ncbi:glycine zipper 2TM domain-containing protein, partial [Piscinibacter sp.]|uniref:glycine zipper 2TM domain-containing protein n=1 Tax=Piscinibacter sp. TaxID=1903157 RepID=UPI0035596B99
MKRLLIAIAATAALAACTTTSPDVIQKGDAQRMSQVQDATVLSVRTVVVEGNQSGVGAVAGGVAGGVAGSTVGGHREGAVVGVLGAVAGAVIGNAVER